MVILGRTCSSIIIAVSSVTTMHVVAQGGGPGVWGDMHNTIISSHTQLEEWQRHPSPQQKT